ncbi:MAG: efflux RND transporter periplasmic adaptor subunit [Armatimonadota bacterium]
MKIGAFFRRYGWGILLLAVVIVVTIIGVGIWKARNPGSMTVLQTQSMDISAVQPPTGPVPVATEVLLPGPFSAAVTYTGSVAPLQEQIIYPRVEGWLTDLRVYNGDQVAGDQILAVIDSPDLQTRLAEASAGYQVAKRGVPVAQSDVAQARAEQAASQADVEAAAGELDRAEATVSASQKAAVQAQKEVKSASANLEYWRAEIAREKKLLDAGAVSLQEYQLEKAQAVTAEAEFENRQAKLEEMQANVKSFEAEVRSKRAALRAARQRAEKASAALIGSNRRVDQTSAMAQQAGAAAATASIFNDYRYILAPFAGEVTVRYTSPGQFVTPSTAILGVVQKDRVRLQANVADTDLPLIVLGAPVVATFKKYPELVISADVTSVSPQANQKSRTAIVEAIVPNPGHKLVPGDSVTLSITTSRAPRVITVPVNAIVQFNGRSAVWVANIREADGSVKTAHLVMVTTGATDGRRVEILSGLKGGDEVIYEGNTYLREGDAVFPTQWGAKGPLALPQPPATEPMPGMGGGPKQPMPGMNH